MSSIVSDQSELTILLCQPLNSLLLNEDDLAMVQQPSTITILYIWSLITNAFSAQIDFHETYEWNITRREYCIIKPLYKPEECSNTFSTIYMCFYNFYYPPVSAWLCQIWKLTIFEIFFLLINLAEIMFGSLIEYFQIKNWYNDHH